ncbi:MAG: hypothetical protein M9913_10345 [Bryobacteraceae bacterium]|nr:hypothetical protein [Solibacteraceae bacterium]MCO5351280.1 hypothetical protein [Bryobacteraceae bacterium]
MRHGMLLLSAPLLLHAAPPLPIEWEMTTAAFGGRKAVVKLDSGARIEGVWLGVTPTTFTMDVDRTKGRNRLPKGVQTIDRSSIVELRVQERRIRGRVIGTTAGYFAGMPLFWSMASPAGGLAVLGSVMTVSHLLGRVSDKATRVVLIKTESPQSGGLRDLEGTGLSIPPEASGLEEAKENMSHETTDTSVVGSGAAVRRAPIADRVGDDDCCIWGPESDCEAR